MTDWSRLSHAYGAAADVLPLLAQAGTDPKSPAWSELWSRLYHQGDTYPASYAALPGLTEIARRWPGIDRAEPLILAGSILAASDWLAEADQSNLFATETVGELRQLAEESLNDPRLRDDRDLYVYLLQALLAFEGDSAWGQALDGITSDEYAVACRHCESENFIAFGQWGCFSTTYPMYMNDTGGKRLPLLPADPSDLDGQGMRLHARALSDGHPEVADKLTYVFGSATCADCNTVFRVDEAIVASRNG